jgi:DNA-binding NarL/FixJ family response regulator
MAPTKWDLIGWCRAVPRDWDLAGAVIGVPMEHGEHWGTMVVRVLIADDHAIVRSGLRAILETRSDFVVCAEARDGREAIDLTVQHKPDVAVIDFSLPILNGIEATREICLRSPRTQVLVLTAHDDEVLIDDALLAGARGFLLKMEDNEQIVEAVARLARHRPAIANN